jgi:hypothetical protein
VPGRRSPAPVVLSQALVPAPPEQQQDRSHEAARWPLCSCLELGAVPCARLHSRLLLWEWGLTVPAELSLAGCPSGQAA